MANLLAPYALCPLIEHRKCLGVCEDSTPGCVIVTLGKNIIIRYRLADQKQVSSWSSKDMLSAPVIYDFNLRSYVAVFKSDLLSCWDDGLVQLNKLNKLKFSRLIHNILANKECESVIVYQNGVIGTLKDELITRLSSKNEEDCGNLEPTEEILSSQFVKIAEHLYVGLLTFDTKTEIKKLHFIPIDEDRADRFNISLENKANGSFNCYTVIEGDSTSLITLWSDGSIFSIELPLKDIKSFPGRELSKVESINVLLPVVMHSFGKQEIVLYGAAPNSEGAVLCIFNLKYGLIGSSQKLKVYCDAPKLWVVGPNRYILCLSGGHLMVVPTRSVTQRLCSLLGVSKVNPDEKNELTQVTTPSWAADESSIQEEEVIENNELSDGLLKKMRDSGVTDSLICEELLPNLLKTMDTEQINRFLFLVNDIPDRWLIDLAIRFIEKPQGELLENVLRRPLVSDNSSLQLVRSKVSLSVALQLLEVISKELDKNPLNQNLLDWATIILDSHYQQYLLSKDESVISTLKAVNNVVQQNLECMASIKPLLGDLRSLKKGCVQLKKSSSISSHSYLVDTINFY